MKTILVVAGALALAACNLQGTVDTGSNAVRRACTAATGLYAGIQVFKEYQPLPADVVDRIERAYAQIKLGCATAVVTAEMLKTIIAASEVLEHELEAAGGQGTKLAEGVRQLRRDVIREGIR